MLIDMFNPKLSFWRRKIHICWRLKWFIPLLYFRLHYFRSILSKILFRHKFRRRAVVLILLKTSLANHILDVWQFRVKHFVMLNFQHQSSLIFIMTYFWHWTWKFKHTGIHKLRRLVVQILILGIGAVFVSVWFSIHKRAI